MTLTKLKESRFFGLDRELEQLSARYSEIKVEISGRTYSIFVPENEVKMHAEYDEKMQVLTKERDDKLKTLTN